MLFVLHFLEALTRVFYWRVVSKRRYFEHVLNDHGSIVLPDTGDRGMERVAGDVFNKINSS